MSFYKWSSITKEELLQNKQLVKKHKYKPKKNIKWCEIHDNGNKPFLVEIHPNEILVYKYKFILTELEKTTFKGEYIIIDYPYSFKNYVKCFVGKDNGIEPKKHHGNSILIQMNKTDYIYIGERIIMFKLDEQIVSFYSPIGNNDVPYPYAVGEKNTYLMIEYYYDKKDNAPALENNNIVYLPNTYIEQHKSDKNINPYYVLWRTMSKPQLKKFKKDHYLEVIELVHRTF
jgi:hypothetical protein